MQACSHSLHNTASNNGTTSDTRGISIQVYVANAHNALGLVGPLCGCPCMVQRTLLRPLGEPVHGPELYRNTLPVIISIMRLHVSMLSE